MGTMKAAKLIGITSFCFILLFLSGCSTATKNGNKSGETTVNESKKVATNEPAKSGETVNLVFWKPPHMGGDSALYAEIIADFEKENPNIKVKHVEVPWDAVDVQYTTAFASNNPPDLVYAPDEWFPRLAAAGSFLNISDRIQEVAQGYDPKVLAAGKYKGKQYGIPYLSAAQAFFFNERLLKEHGITNVPKKLDEVVSAASKITDNKKQIYGFPDEMLNFNEQLWLPLFKGAGVDITNKDLTKAAFNTSEGVKVVDHIVALYKNGAAPSRAMYDAQQMTDIENKGKIGMMNILFDRLVTFKKENPGFKDYLITVPPMGQQKVAQFVNFGHMFIANATKHPEEAWKFLKFLTNKENAEKASSTIKLFSGRNDSEWAKKDPDAAPFLEAYNNPAWVPLTVHWREMARTLGAKIDLAIYGQLTAQEALAEAESEINAMLDGN